VFRHLLPLSENDLSLLRRFGDENAVHVWLQPGGPDRRMRFIRKRASCTTICRNFGLRIRFRPTDFTQVNHAVNRILVSRAVRLLDPQPGERVADLFCGLGNFSLPIATRGARSSASKAAASW